ncbi:MAG: hypothetical protein Q9223_005452 [Gallowayella weberi]
MDGVVIVKEDRLTLVPKVAALTALPTSCPKFWREQELVIESSMDGAEPDAKRTPLETVKVSDDDVEPGREGWSASKSFANLIEDFNMTPIVVLLSRQLKSSSGCQTEVFPGLTFTLEKPTLQ